MSKFGELIDVDVPVLFDFYTDWNEASVAMHPVITEVATALGDKARVIKVNVDDNRELSEALRIKSLPTLIVYKGGDMIWRQSGEQEANTLISLITQFIAS